MPPEFQGRNFGLPVNNNSYRLYRGSLGANLDQLATPYGRDRIHMIFLQAFEECSALYISNSWRAPSLLCGGQPKKQVPITDYQCLELQQQVRINGLVGSRMYSYLQTYVKFS